jgi:WD40 repeat protein
MWLVAWKVNTSYYVVVCLRKQFMIPSVIVRVKITISPALSYLPSLSSFSFSADCGAPLYPSSIGVIDIDLSYDEAMNTGRPSSRRGFTSDRAQPTKNTLKLTIHTTTKSTMSKHEEDGLDSISPREIEFDSHVFDLAFHPTHNLVAAGLIAGSVHCYQYDLEENGGNTHKWSLDAHKKSCRDVEFNHDGRLLYTASRDKSWRAIDVETGVVSTKKLKAHEYVLFVFFYSTFSQF